LLRRICPSGQLYRIAAVALFATSLAACGGSGNTPAIAQPALEGALRQNLSEYLKARSSVEHISTLSMTVTFRSQTLPITLAVGTTQYGGGNLVTGDSLFQIGSNTKAFTAVIVLQLEAAGMLSIDDTVGKWLPQYPAWKNVTIRQLLNMTSGISTYDATAAWEADYAANPLLQSAPAQLIGYVYPAIATPGAAWEYSNTNYILAQLIVDKASPLKSYEAELNRLIASVGLTSTFYQPYFYPSSVMARLIAGYEVNTDDPGLAALLGKDTSGFSLGWTQAAGGIVSKPGDLATWIRALFEGSVLPPKQLAELTSLVSIPGGQPISALSGADSKGFGLGVFQISVPTMGLFWGYQGSTIGYRATYAYFPATGLLISIFTNSQTTAAANTLDSVLLQNVFQTLKAAGRAS
jgi:D-alanyl-D-alanine carboxypeptidase